MFAVFIKEYQYTAEQALNEYAKTFFALCAQIPKMQANTDKRLLLVVNNSLNSDSASNMISKLNDIAEGAEKYIRQAKTLKEVKKNNG